MHILPVSRSAMMHLILQLLAMQVRESQRRHHVWERFRPPSHQQLPSSR
jgi:hypothetical protein